MIDNRGIRTGVRALVLAAGLGAAWVTPALATMRSDGATELPIPYQPHSIDPVRPGAGIGNSFQNPCWGPSSDKLVFTQYANSYNAGSSIASVASFPDGALSARLSPLPADTVDAVNEPGSCWSAAKNLVAYSGSDLAGVDQIVAVRPNGTGTPIWVTGNRDNLLTAWEPSFSPHGNWLVFEAHLLCVKGVPDCTPDDPYSGQGTIWKVKMNGTGSGTRLTQLTCPSARFADQQPNWAPTNPNLVVFQRNVLGADGTPTSTDLYTLNPSRHQPCATRTLTSMSARWTTVTAGVARATAGRSSDASFSADGTQIVYSGGTPKTADGRTHIFLLDVSNDLPPQQVTHTNGVYDGAPSYSRDGTIAFESCPFPARVAACPVNSDASPGTRIWTIPAP